MGLSVLQLGGKRHYGHLPTHRAPHSWCTPFHVAWPETPQNTGEKMEKAPCFPQDLTSVTTFVPNIQARDPNSTSCAAAQHSCPAGTQWAGRTSCCCRGRAVTHLGGNGTVSYHVGYQEAGEVASLELHTRLQTLTPAPPW